MPSLSARRTQDSAKPVALAHHRDEPERERKWDHVFVRKAALRLIVSGYEEAVGWRTASSLFEDGYGAVQRLSAR